MNSFENFAPESRIWVYQCNRLLMPAEVDAIKNKATVFTDQWTAHQQLLKATFDLEHNLFLIFCVDQQTAAASGCSIDKSLHLVQQLEQDFNIRLLDRMMAAYQQEDTVVPFNLKELNTLFASGIITNDTIVFNNLVDNLTDFNSKWKVTLKDSWMSQMIAPAALVK